LVSDQNTQEVFLTLLASRFARANFFQACAFIAGVLPNSPTGAFSPLLRTTPGISKCGTHKKHANGNRKSETNHSRPSMFGTASRFHSDWNLNSNRGQPNVKTGHS
jgi:hypothetical protein